MLLIAVVASGLFEDSAVAVASTAGSGITIRGPPLAAEPTCVRTVDPACVAGVGVNIACSPLIGVGVDKGLVNSASITWLAAPRFNGLFLLLYNRAMASEPGAPVENDGTTKLCGGGIPVLLVAVFTASVGGGVAAIKIYVDQYFGHGGLKEWDTHGRCYRSTCGDPNPTHHYGKPRSLAQFS